MKVKLALALIVVILQLAFPRNATAGHKDKKDEQRGMLEKMDSVPCGAKERGVSGLGTIWASVGLTHINSQEKLCPQYLLRTDEMDYEIRPTNTKNPVLLPVGKEAEFKLRHNQIHLRLPDSDGKTRTYNVVSSSPSHPNSDSDQTESSQTEQR